MVYFVKKSLLKRLVFRPFQYESVIECLLARLKKHDVGLDVVSQILNCLQEINYKNEIGALNQWETFLGEDSLVIYCLHNKKALLVFHFSSLGHLRSWWTCLGANQGQVFVRQVS